MEKCGVPMTADAVSEVIKEFDADQDGSLNFQEFVSMMNKMMSGPTEKDIRKSMFEVFDGNMDGYITVAEVRTRDAPSPLARGVAASARARARRDEATGPRAAARLRGRDPF